MLRVMIAEDHDDLRNGLRECVANEHDLDCVAAVASADQLAAAVAELKPDVLVLDLLLDGGSSLRALNELTRIAPSLRIILYSGYISEPVQREARRRGADAMVPKGGSMDELLGEIRRQGRRRGDR